MPAWAAVGASAFLAGTTRLLLSTTLIVSETSGCTPVLVPQVGVHCGQRACSSVYSQRTQQPGG